MNVNITSLTEIPTTSDLNAGASNSEIFRLQEVQLDLLKIFGIIIIIIGTVGHFITLFVLVGSLRRASKGLVSNASGVYMIALSLSALIPLYSGLLRWVIRSFDWINDIRDQSLFSCVIGSALSYFSLQNFSCIQAAIAIDRLLAVSIPQRYPQICSTKVGIIVTCSIIGVLLAINFGILSQSNYLAEDGNMAVCIHPKEIKNILKYVDLVLFAVLPGTVMIPCNIAIIIKLRINANRTRRHSRKAQHSLTTMLVSLNVIFIITTVPISVVSNIPWGDFWTLQYTRRETAWFICLLIQYLGTASTFIVYTLSGSKFREELKRLNCTHRSSNMTETRNSNRDTVNSVNSRLR